MLIEHDNELITINSLLRSAINTYHPATDSCVMGGIIKK